MIKLEKVIEDCNIKDMESEIEEREVLLKINRGTFDKLDKQLESNHKNQGWYYSDIDKRNHEIEKIQEGVLNDLLIDEERIGKERDALQWEYNRVADEIADIGETIKDSIDQSYSAKI